MARSATFWAAQPAAGSQLASSVPASGDTLDDLARRADKALALLQHFNAGGNWLSLDTGCPVCGIADTAPVVWDGSRAVHRFCVGKSSAGD